MRASHRQSREEDPLKPEQLERENERLSREVERLRQELIERDKKIVECSGARSASAAAVRKAKSLWPAC